MRYPILGGVYEIVKQRLAKVAITLRVMGCRGGEPFKREAPRAMRRASVGVRRMNLERTGRGLFFVAINACSRPRHDERAVVFCRLIIGRELCRVSLARVGEIAAGEKA